MANSIQDVLRARQRDAFIGRTRQVTTFRTNLTMASDSEARRFLFDVSGPAGVGKTSLLRRLETLALEEGWATAVTDENYNDIPSILASIADQLEKQGASFSDFISRHKVYRTKRHELEADPDAPQGMPAFLGRSLVREGLKLAKQVPVVGAVADAIDLDTAGNLGADLATFLYKKVSSKDDVRLLLAPTEVLTPLFLAELNTLSTNKAVALFFDTFERTSGFVDPWLRFVLEGQFGQVSTAVLFTIAGQIGLDNNAWAPYEDLLVRWPIEVFTLDETREYLSRKGIKDDSTVRAVAQLSGGLPLLVATLSVDTPSIPLQAGRSAADTAIKRFLKWVDSEDRRTLALAASVPRHFNRDVVGVVSPGVTDTSYEWLKDMPFVSRSERGFRYHDVIRTNMLTQLRIESPDLFQKLHTSLAGHYGTTEVGAKSSDYWYHSLSAAPDAEADRAIEAILSAACLRRDFASEIARAVLQAAVELERDEIAQKATTLLAAIDALTDEDLEASSTSLLPFAKSDKIPTRLRALIYSALAVLAHGSSQLDDAESHLLDAVQLDSTSAYYWRLLGQTLRGRRQFLESVDACSKAIELDPQDASSYLARGRAYAAMSAGANALADFDKAMSLRPQYEHACYKHIAHVHEALEEHEQAIDALRSAIKAQPACVSCWTGLAKNLHLVHLDSPIADLVRAAVDIDENDSKVTAARASAIATLDQHTGLKELNAVIQSSPNDADALALRGEANARADQLADALADFDASIALNSSRSWVFRRRAKARFQTNDLSGAVADLEAASEMDPSDLHRDLSQIGDLRARLGDDRKAAEAYRRALQLDSACPHCWRGFISAYTLFAPDANVADVAKELAVPHSQDFLVMVCRAQGLYTAGLHDQAIAALKDAVTGIDADEYWYRSRTYAELGLYELALGDIEVVLRIRPDGPPLDVEKGLLLSYLGRHEEALVAYSADPDTLVSSYNIAVSQTLSRGHEQAEQAIEKANETIRRSRATQKLRSLYAEAGLLAVCGDLEAALPVLREVLKNSTREIRTFVLRDMAWQAWRTDSRFVALIDEFIDLDSARDAAAKARIRTDARSN